MRKKVSILYQLSEVKNSIIILYVIVTCIMTLAIVLPWGKLDPTFDYNSRANGLEIFTVMFLIIKGTDFFKKDFIMLMQNSFSRKSIFISKLSVMLFVSFIMSFIGNVLLWIGNIIPNKNKVNFFQGIYDMYYHDRFVQYGSLRIFFESFIFCFILYLFSYCLGFLIIVIKNQMSRKLKIGLVAAIPSFIFIIFPLINDLSGDRFNVILSKGIDIALGISSGSPFALMLTAVIIVIIFFSIIYYYTKRAIFTD